MRRSTSRIGKLPREVLEQVNEKLYTSWEYREIRKWLFEEVAVEDVPALGLVKGEKFGLVWLRAGKSTEHAWHHCELALGNWFRTWHGVWVRQKLLRSEPLRALRRAKMLTQEARMGSSPRSHEEREAVTNTAGETPAPLSDEVSIDGGDILMRSVLIDTISSIKEGPKDRREVAALANAWARLNAGKMEEEKLKLKTEEALTVGLRAVKEQIKALPEALELFYKMTDVIDREMAKADPLGK